MKLEVASEQRRRHVAGRHNHSSEAAPQRWVSQVELVEVGSCHVRGHATTCWPHCRGNFVYLRRECEQKDDAAGRELLPVQADVDVDFCGVLHRRQDARDLRGIDECGSDHCLSKLARQVLGIFKVAAGDGDDAPTFPRSHARRHAQDCRENHREEAHAVRSEIEAIVRHLHFVEPELKAGGLTNHATGSDEASRRCEVPGALIRQHSPKPACERPDIVEVGPDNSDGRPAESNAEGRHER
eukprot:282789-Rhodomonas_salina.1